MSVRDSILQCIHRSRDPLDEYFGPLHDFLWEQHAPDGGFRGPDGKTSLYHTTLALEAMTTLDIEPPRTPVSRYLARFATGHGLSLLELTSLIRAWHALGHEVRGLVPKLERFRATDGGFAHVAGRAQSQVDATFLAEYALSSGNDYSCLHRCLSGEAYGNSAEEPWPGTIATSMAVVLLHEQTDQTTRWLLDRQDPKGGFCATPSTQIPDVLSTAFALHALAQADKISTEMVDPMMDFLDSLWQNKGGFQQSWTNPEVSIETIYYGLLALGHLG